MDLGFIDSPHLLACVSYSPPSTRLKYCNELNLSCTLNQSRNISVKDGKSFLSFIFGTDQSQNKAKDETGSYESLPNNIPIWNTNVRSSGSQRDLMLCSPEDKFSPFMSSSPNVDESKQLKTYQDIRSNIGEHNHFVHNSHFQKQKINSSENSSIFDNDSSNSLNQGFDDGNSGNNCSEDSTIFENDSIKLLNEESLKPFLSFYESTQISPKLFVSENISTDSVSRKPGVLEKGTDVRGSESVVLPETSCAYVSAAPNTDSCILQSIENNEDLCQVNAVESNNMSNTLVFFQTTKNEIIEKNINVEIPFILNKPFREQFLESNVTILETPEPRFSILNGKSEDNFQIATKDLSAGDGLDSEFCIKYNMIRLENMTRLLQDMADSFEFKNECVCENTILEEDFTLFLNNELHQRPESIIKDEVADIFHNSVSDLAFDNKLIGIHSKNTPNLISENICVTKHQSSLRDSWNLDCDISAYDKTITSANIGENLNFEYDAGLYSEGSRFHPGHSNNTICENVNCQSELRDSWQTDCGVSISDKAITSANIGENSNFEYDPGRHSEGSRFHPVNSINTISENVRGINCRSELPDFLQTDCGISISDPAITARCIRENLDSPILYNKDKQITKCIYLRQSGKQLTPNQNIKIPERKKIPQICVESFMKEKSLSSNDFSSHAFTEIADRTWCAVESFRADQTSLQVVSYSSKTSQASTASRLEFSPEMDFIGKRKEFDFLKFSAKNVDLMFGSNNGHYSLNEGDAKSIITPTKKTFPSISNNHVKEHEFSVFEKENKTFLSKIDENREGGSEIELDDFVSASEYCSSSSEVFYDLEEIYDVSDGGSSEKENCYTHMLKSCEVATSPPDLKNKSILPDRSIRNHEKSQASSETKNNSTSDLFNSNEPIIIKYLNEHTEEIEEMLIYPIEYHEKLMGKMGRKSLSRREVLEKLIERSKFYVGKPVGIILDVKDIRKKHKPMPEESVSSAETLKERNPERSNILTDIDFHDTKTPSGFASERSIHYKAQTVRNPKGDHRSEDLQALTVSCPRKLQQNETCACKEVQTERDDEINPCHSEIFKHTSTSHTDSAVYLRENTNVSSSGQKIVLSSVSKCKSKKRCYSPSPIQELDAASSKPHNSSTENKHKRWLQEMKQPLNNVLNSGSIANSNKPSTFSLHSTKQREVKILRKMQSTEKFAICPMRSSVSEMKGNLSQRSACSSSSRAIQKYDSSSKKYFNDSLEKWLQKREPKGNSTHNSAGYSSSAIQKYDSSSNKRFNNSQEKWLQKRESKGNLTHHFAGYSSSEAIQKYDSSSNKHFNNSQEKWSQNRESKGNLSHHSIDFPCSLAIQKYDTDKQLNNSQEKWFQKMDLSTRKRVNIEEIISSDFKIYFNFYAKRGGRLKSGSVMSKSNSNYWFKKAGVVYDGKSLKIAEESFAEVARKKVVLNICDYMQFLITLSRREKIWLADLVQQLKTADISGCTDAKKRMDSSLSLNANLYNDSNSKSHCRYAKHLEKAFSAHVPERFPSFPLSSAPRKRLVRI